MKRKLIASVVAFAYGAPARDRRVDPSSRMALWFIQNSRTRRQ